MLCRLASGARIPSWALEGEFFCVVRTRDELSMVCSEERMERMPANVSPEMSAERGWVSLMLEGPFPFSVTGVLASFVRPLADAQIPIFAISTFDTDYVLIKIESLDKVRTALRAAGHEELAN